MAQCVRRVVAICAVSLVITSTSLLLQASTAAAAGVERVAGEDRYATSVQVSRRGWPTGARAVVIVRGRDARDGIIATGLAGLHGHAPILLNPSDILRDDVKAELVRLGASEAYLVGGQDALSPDVESAVREVVPSVTRFGGVDAIATAAEVAIDGFTGGLPGAARSSVFLVNPNDVAGGIAAGGIAAARGVPILFAQGGSLTPETQSAIDALAPTTTYIVGGQDAIGDSLSAAVPGARRIVDNDVYATAVALARALDLDWSFDLSRVVLVSGWADGVTGAGLAGALNAPLLLTDSHVWHGRLVDWFWTLHPAVATLVGGEAAIDQYLFAAIADGGGPLARGPGSTGALVGLLQKRLLDSGFNPGVPTGVFDFHTKVAVWAQQKAFGLPITGAIGDAELMHLRAGDRAPVLRPDITAAYGDHVEISLSRQLIQVVRGGQVQVAVHTSTGAPWSPTVQGLFRIYDRWPGFNGSGMYMSMYFYGAYAIHGYDPVPLYPASHGCARVVYPDADLLWNIVWNGMPVIVWE